MNSVEWFTVLTFGILDSGFGIILNASIVIFYVKKGFPMNKSDQVHLIMGLVNIVLQCVMTTQAALWVSTLHAFVKAIYLPAFFLNLLLVYCSYWLTSWLCAVYCISIASYTHQLFVWLKQRISAFLPHLLMLSIAGSLIICVPAFWVVTLDPEKGAFGNATVESVNLGQTFQFSQMYVIPVVILGCGLPFVLSFTSIILTIISLLQHMQTMKQNHMDSGQSKLHAHTRAVKTMTMHLILILSCFIAEMLCFSTNSITINAKTVVGFFCMLSYPSAQATIIFLSNSKLRSAIVALCCLKNLCNKPNQDHNAERVNTELQASG